MKEYALELIEKGKRIDGRAFDQFRKIEIVRNAIKSADGSARVKFGETEVIAGVKIGIGTPFPDTPDQGILIVNSEFSPIASPEFEAGPPGEDAIELARVVDRGIRESKAIELEKLCITPGEKVLSVFIDIHIINHHGNLLDAAALASIIALLNTKMPKVEGDKINREEYVGNLPIAHLPINISVGKVGNFLIIDPTFEEEKILESKLCIAVREDDKICALQKQGSRQIKFDELEKMIDLAIEKSKELRRLCQQEH